MYQEHTVGVVVVAYNEEGLVGEVIDTLPSFIDRAYVVDDGSTDGTWAEIQTHAQRVNEALGTDETVPADDTESSETLRVTEGPELTDGQSDGAAGQVRMADNGDQRESPRGDGGFERTVVPIRHETNQGVGGALATGYQRAREDGMDVTVVMAGDNQMDPEECHRIIAPVVEGRAEYAKGNRLLNPELRAEMPNWRLFGNTVLTILTKIASGYWQMMDPANGYTAISHEALERLDLDELYAEYGAAHDILIKLNVEDVCIADVPVPASYGEAESDIAYSSFVPNLSLLLLRGFCWRLKTKYLVRDCHPFVLFYGLGVLGGTVALLEWVGALLDDDDAGTRSVLSTVLFLVSSALVTFGMVFDHLDNQDLELRADDRRES
jgi:glycosyltransferase involved in cell wall biosynthesis